MTPQELKNSILQLAVQGKLVEQRAEEGTAEELYKKIQTEKQKLTAEKKIKKEKPLPEITAEEIPFDIPESWKWIRLGDLGIYKKGPFGSALTKNIFVSKGVNTIKVYEQKNAIQKDAFIGDYYITKDYFENKMQGFEVYPGDIIVSCAGTIGETFVMPSNIEQGIINQALMRIRLFSPVYVPYFLLYFDVVLKQNAKVFSKGSAIKNIPPFDILKKYLVSLPPLEEQKRIVAKIEALLPQIDRYEKAWNKLEDFNKRFPEDMQKSILQYAVQGKLVEQRSEEGTAEELYKKIQAEKQKLIAEKKIKKEKPLPEITAEEIPFDIPESWKWVRFGEISDIIGTGLIRSNSEQFSSGKYYYFKMNNIGNFDGKCNFDNMNMINASNEELKKYRLSAGDFLFNTRNSRELVGKVAVVPNIDRDIIFNNNILKIKFLSDIVPNYISTFFISPLGRMQLHKFITNTTNVAAIYQKQLITLLIPLPPIEEQKRIVAKIEELLPLCEKLKRS